MAEAPAHSGLLNTLALHVDDPGGSGRPVVLIHGWPMSGQAWALQVPALTDAGLRPITYDRRGFGRSGTDFDAYDYDTLADDLAAVLTELNLTDVTLVGFSMGGGEVARYMARHGTERLASVVFAAAVPPYLLHGDDNPDGPLPPEAAEGSAAALTEDRELFFDGFTKAFFTAGGELAVTDSQRQEALALCRESDEQAALACQHAFSTTDFRDDLTKIDVPTLIIHGDADQIVPFEGSGKRTHEAVTGSRVVLISGGPHGLNVSHHREFNEALVDFCRS
ncbi:alpha/beta fold hydrolase [Propionibacteriaceae bacterium Y2011]